MTVFSSLCMIRSARFALLVMAGEKVNGEIDVLGTASHAHHVGGTKQSRGDDRQIIITDDYMNLDRGHPPIVVGPDKTDCVRKALWRCRWQ